MAYPFEIRIVEDGFCVYDCPPDWHVNESSATFHRVYYSHEGYALYEDDHQQIELKKGCLYIFPTNKPYRINHDTSRPFKCLWFHIVISPIILNPVMCFNIEKNPTVFHILNAIENSLEMHLDLESRTCLITELLCSLFFLVSHEEKFLVLNDAYLMRITDYIHNNYRNVITNEYLSDISGYNKSYLIRLFRKTFGVTPQKYILNYRLDKAITLIRDKMSIAEVASLVGYTDNKAFCRTFKKAKGVPPSEYKKSHYWQP